MSGSKTIVLFWGCWGGGLFRTFFRLVFFLCLVRGMIDGEFNVPCGKLCFWDLGVNLGPASTAKM